MAVISRVEKTSSTWRKPYATRVLSELVTDSTMMAAIFGVSLGGRPIRFAGGLATESLLFLDPLFFS